MPRYSAVRGAEFLSEITGAKIVFESSLPSVESFRRAEIGQLKLIKTEDQKNNFPKVEIVSPEQQKKNQNFPISKILTERLSQTLKNKKQAVIFVNRRGFSTRTICENCKSVLKCPKCNRALVFSDESGQYHCLHCAYKMDLLNACPACGGFQFSHRGIGTQTVEKEIKKIFPGARLARFDADTGRNPTKYKNILSKFSKSEINILVGTQSAIKGIYSDKIELVAAISGRDFAEGIEYKSRELTLSRLFNMANLLNKRGGIIIQSFISTNSIFHFFENQALETYYNQELKMRERFSYPPFCKFVKLVFQGKSGIVARREAGKTFDLLRATGNNEIEIIGPYRPLSEFFKGLYKLNILLKIAAEKDIRNLPIRSVIGGLRKGWSVDVDPVNLF